MTSPEQHSIDRTSAARRVAAGWLETVETLAGAARRLRGELFGRDLPAGLTPAQVSVLWSCRGLEPVAQHRLAAALSLSPAQISSTVEQLRRGGLLQGIRPAHDRRLQLWSPTPAGRQALDGLLAAIAPAAEAIADRSPLRAAAQILEALATAGLAGEALAAAGQVRGGHAVDEGFVDGSLGGRCIEGEAA